MNKCMNLLILLILMDTTKRYANFSDDEKSGLVSHDATSNDNFFL